MTIRVEYQLCNMGEPTGDSLVVKEFDNQMKKWEWEEAQSGHPFLHYEVRSVVEPKSSLASVRAALKAHAAMKSADYKTELNKIYGPIGQPADPVAEARKAGIAEAAALLQAEVDRQKDCWRSAGVSDFSKSTSFAHLDLQKWADRIMELSRK